ncbi:MAG TPA: sigma-70 family RNA polymerase sigma factor [Solirubrobacteraceae bacterium]|jgi:RNA polymerase sigma factor (sigma-70 family)|nr:sigma-70 family RNA polymerase sigma factor [Solirubrobacteraceae bacterium]
MDAELTTGIAARALPLPLRLLGDERLARLVGSGHEEAFSILYQRHHQALYRYCRSLVGTDVDAQDALQSAMTGALVALRVDRRDAPIRPWLFRIAYNESMTQLRRRRPTSELSDDLPALESSPERAAEERSRISLLLSDLRELPERQRGALVMRELSGLSHQEVAEALGMSVGATKQTVFEARRSLQEFDQGRSMACEQIRRLISDGDGRSLRGRRVRAHLRDCSGCAAFAAAIPQRQADLRALTPALPASAAAGLLWRITGAGSGQGSGGGAGLISGATGKAVATAASGKLLTTGALIVATAAVGTGGVLRAITPGLAPHPAAAIARTAGPASAAGGPINRHASGGSARLLAATEVGSVAGAHHAHTAGSSHGKSSSATPGHSNEASNGSGHTRGHPGAGKSASGSSTATHGEHLGAQRNSAHGSPVRSKRTHTKGTKVHRTRSTAPGSKSATHRATGSSGAVGIGSATQAGGASAGGLAKGVGKATFAAGSAGNSGAHRAKVAQSGE